VKKFEPDKLDMQILEILEDNCSKTYREIAQITGKDLWMVRDRIVMLKKRGVIKGCKGDIDFSAVGLNCRALVMFNVSEDKIDDFIAFARSVNEFKRLIIVTGERRFFLEIIGENCNSIREFARKTLPKYGIYDLVFEVVLDIPK